MNHNKILEGKRMPNRRVRLVAATFVVSALTVVGPVAQAAAPAPVAKASQVDPVGDVDTEGSSDPASRFVPSLDITKVGYRFLPARKAVTVTVRFKDLKPVKTPQFPWHKHYITVIAYGVSQVQVGFVLERNPWAIGTHLRKFTGDNEDVPCRGDRFTVDTANDLATITMPSRCLGNVAKARFEVYSIGYQTFEDGEKYLGLDYRAKSPAIRMR